MDPRRGVRIERENLNGDAIRRTDSALPCRLNRAAKRGINRVKKMKNLHEVRAAGRGRGKRLPNRPETNCAVRRISAPVSRCLYIDRTLYRNHRGAQDNSM
jgi:hypothetical protein